MHKIMLFFMLTLMTFEVKANTALEQIQVLETAKNASPLRVTEPPIKQDIFTQTYVMVFFLSGSCHFCQAFAPVVDQYAKARGFTVLAYTTNGAGLPDFPSPLPFDVTLKAHYFKENPVMVPACFLLNTKTAEAYPVSFGALTAPELEARMQALIPKIQDYERGQS